MSDRIYNFSAGPAILPEPVLLRAREALWNYQGSGVGVMEHSHRSPEFTEILEDADALCRRLANIPDNYRVLFLQGGASSQFYMVPMNLLRPPHTADYVDTGVWSTKAIKEAQRFGGVHAAASNAESGFSALPVHYEWSDAPAYVHYTSNNTIRGTQFRQPPAAPKGAPIVCDASSDIFSQPIDIEAHGLIYAGAQKNLGPAGVTLVIIRDDLVAAGHDDIPTMLQYRTHSQAGSRFNTPPVFGVYVLREVLAWLEGLGGLEAMAAHNRAKAAVIYEYLDQSQLFRGTAEVASRSLMNICFRTDSPELDTAFVAEAAARGLAGLKGHRVVGGMRASVYNAFPAAGCNALVAFMEEFERKRG